MKLKRPVPSDRPFLCNQRAAAPFPIEGFSLEKEKYMDLSTMPWFFAVLGGAAILALVLAYGVYKSSSASRRQRDAAEKGARDLYDKDNKES